MLPSMATKSTEQLWMEWVWVWCGSGFDVYVFAAGKGFAGSTLVWRARELRKRRPSAAPAPTGVTLRRLVRESDEAPAARSATAATCAVVVRVGGAELVVTPGFDAQLVRELVRCLAEGEAS